MRTWVAQMRKGLVELCVVAVLREGEAYGYQILQKMGRVECLAISESTVYPILARLAEEGMVKVRVSPSPDGPPRRYYRLTPLGRSKLNEMASYWTQIQTAVDSLVSGDMS